MTQDDDYVRHLIKGFIGHEIVGAVKDPTAGGFRFKLDSGWTIYATGVSLLADDEIR